jgi:thioredoxin reductase
MDGLMRAADIAVVGAGPAGIAAALTAARLGARVVLLDEQDAPGGHLRWTVSDQPGIPEPGIPARGVEIARWAERELPVAGVELVRGVVWGLFEERLLGVVDGSSAWQLRAEHVILATGATDVVKPFPGWELPGAMTATAAQRLMHLHRVLPGRDVAVVGTGEIAREVARDLQAAGARVRAHATPAEASAGGSGHVEWFELGGERHAVDAVVIACGRQPDAQLALQALAEVEYSAADRTFLPRRSAALETSQGGVYVAGEAGGNCGVAVAFAQGRLAALAALGSPETAAAAAELAQIAPKHQPAPPAHRLAGATVVCRCEQMRADQVRAAIGQGARSLNDVKRRSRAGMGPCQGIFCLPAIAAMLCDEAGVAAADLAPMTPRPPARIVPLAALAALADRSE